MRNDYLVFGQPYIGEEEIAEVMNTLKSGWLGTGPKTAQFEQDFASYVGSKYAIAVSSCTAALHLSILALHLEPGDEVITTPLTFCATSNAILHSLAKPVFVDVDPTTGNIDPEKIKEKITDKTKAILPVHLYGRSCDLTALQAICQEHKLKLIGDCAHSVETEWQGQRVGSIGDLNCFSFYPTKNIVTGEGGMVTTDDEAMAANIKRLALHGMTKDAWKRFSDTGYKHYQVVSPGYKYNMTDIQSSLGLHQLKRIDELHKKREGIWNRYQEAFKDLPLLLPAPVEENTRHAYHLYAPCLKLDDVKLSRDDLLQALHERNIGSGVHYIAVHLQPYYEQTYGTKEGDFPIAENFSHSTFSLPLSAKLTDEDVGDVIREVTDLLS